MNDPAETILVAEDSEDDVFFLRRALKQAGIINPIQVVSDGREALEYFSRSGKFQDCATYPLPCLLFLDLKLPYKHGFEILAWIRSQADLAGLPVAVLTSSSEQRDVDQARQLGAQSFLVKPASPDDLRSLMHRIDPSKPADPPAP